MESTQTAMHTSPKWPRAAGGHREFDRSRLEILPLGQRRHDLRLDSVMDIADVEVTHDELRQVGRRIRAARDRGATVALMMGGHVLRAGNQRYIIDLMERGALTDVAVNGAFAIHDYEMALIGATTESVARYISEGQFGLWHETGGINDLIRCGAAEGMGLGEAVGRGILAAGLPHADLSVLAAAVRLGVNLTVHVGIGNDIIHEHPNCDGAALGATSYRDFLRFTHAMESIEGGVVMNFGSAVMAPEVYLKSLAMVRNVARQEGRTITDFSVLVCDLRHLPSDYRRQPCKDEPDYYFRPWKTMLVRTVAEGGESFYVRGDHRETFPQLHSAIVSG